ncbi:FN1 [Bugula neritina]|uniref:FN1 n=1 Tax=Bugula neritina TaxID=10212 RepID=A0A7J7KHE2_BUGNE|nr:FN1 [Bugula neritina]
MVSFCLNCYIFATLLIPSDVVSTRANPSGTNITLEWTYNDTHVVSGFRLSCIPAVGLCGDRDSPLDIPDNTVRTYTLQGATPGQDYNVSIQAYVNTTSDSVQSGWVEFDTVKLVPSDVVPTKANPSGTNITLEWTYNDTHVVSGFRLSCIPAVGSCGDRNSPLDIPDNTVRTYTLQVLLEERFILCLYKLT